MKHHTKIVATIGPASNSPEIIREMVKKGMSVARLNFSHGSYEEHAHTIMVLRSVSKELDTPITLLQDLQGPKIRVDKLPKGQIEVKQGQKLKLIPDNVIPDSENTIIIDYPYLAEEAQIGAQILLDDGLLEFKIVEIESQGVWCEVIEGGILKNRKGVNLPSLNLRLPSMTEKDKKDLKFGLSEGIDWVSLSFVRKSEDIIALKSFLAENNAQDTPVIAKIEKPQAIDNLEDIINQCDGIMVARGDLGVEMSAEKVPLLQKQIISLCNQKSIPVITATQMLDSMIRNSRPTRAEASDVANAIFDGTDAVMLSGESAVGDYPVKAVDMMAKIATIVEPQLNFVNNPPYYDDATNALSEALNIIDKTLSLKFIVTFTSSGYTSMIAAGERPKAPVLALTPHEKVYHRLNLIWGVKPILIPNDPVNFEELVAEAERIIKQRNLGKSGDQILIMAGIPTGKSQGTNFLKIHQIN
ncbi:MAG: pyruvate kinase [Cyanobacteria bacterium]|nr:pyruvate kinase [Cyanobacteria bacterium CG_2015-16_32_12]NCO77175.1 pyruvate kinase [Cyanobacteria bacterium CG_2015-22_32_23]NCQ40780.1 pyruvate kinase [Cyanobacteria bacterium CG_2015-04_32_10]